MEATKASAHFSKKYYDAEKQKFYMDCKHCGERLAYNGNGSARVAHMKSFHADVKLSNKIKEPKENSQISLIENSGQGKQASIKDLLLNKNHYAAGSKEKEERNDAVFDYIVKTRKPVSTVDDVWFTKLLAKFDNRYRLPCRQTFTNTIIPNKFIQLKAEMREVLDTVRYASVTTDGWTSLGNISYMGVTVHFVHNFKLKSYLLALKPISTSHTAENLASELNQVLTEWGLEKKIVTATTDGAGNIKKAIKTSKNLEYINCLSHMLNLVVKRIFDNDTVFKLIAKCRSLVGTFKHSSTMTAELASTIKKLNSTDLVTELVSEEEDIFSDESIQNQLNAIEKETEPEKKKALKLRLVQDIVTRWNSTYMMLESVFKAHSAIVSVIEQNKAWLKKYKSSLLDYKDLEIVEDLMDLLHPFLQITRLASGSKYVTSSIILPAVTRLLEILQVYRSKNDNQFLEDLAVSMHNDLADRSTVYFSNEILKAASFMDPRYRSMSFIKDVETRDLYKSQAQIYIKRVFSERNLSNSDKLVCTPPAAKKAKLAEPRDFSLCCSSMDEEVTPTSNANEQMIRELTMFRSIKVDVNDQSCPLSFYKDNQYTLPGLAQVAEFIFCSTASSVPSECVFSETGHIITVTRNRTGSELAEELVMLAHNKS